MRGVPLFSVKTLMGHADSRTTEQYAHARWEGIRAQLGSAFASERGEADALRAELERAKRELRALKAGTAQI
ncbi:MAG: hypothetical protein AAGK21_13080 [Bacteroidota bacterium]